MNRKYDRPMRPATLAFGFGLLAWLAPGCATPTATPSPAATKEGRMQQDLHYLADNLARLHIDAFHSVDRAAFFAEVDGLDRDLGKLTDHEFAVRMRQLVVLIGDGHTGLSDTVLFDRSLPLRFARFSDGVFVVAASGDHVGLIGHELIAVEGVPLTDVVQALSTVISRDSEYDLYGDAAPLIAFPDLMAGLDLIPDPDRIALTVRGEDGAEQTHTVSMPPTKEPDEWVRDPDSRRTLAARHRARPYSREYLEGPQVLYIAYNQCRNDETESFRVFARDVLKFADDERPRAIVIDLRHNGGGNSQIMQPLIRGLERRSRLNRPDRLFVLIGSHTYSSAMLNAWQLDARTEATLVGMPTGGKPNSYGEVRTFKLPNSGWTVYYCTKLFDPDPEDRSAVMPHVRIEQSSREYFGGRDPVMQYVLARAAEQPE